MSLSPSFSRFFVKTAPSPLAPLAPLAAVSLDDKRASKWRPRFVGPFRARRAGEREALILTIVCALDMYTTLWWVMTGRATEANTNLAWTFEHHPVVFVMVKCASCLPALMLAPLLARRHPRFTVWLLRGIIAFYVGYYLLNVR